MRNDVKATGSIAITGTAYYPDAFLQAAGLPVLNSVCLHFADTS